jgi:hypothetical protein
MRREIRRRRDQECGPWNWPPKAGVTIAIMIDTNEAHRAREEQYREMMNALEKLEGHYGGVRGALLKRVRSELEKTAPKASTLSLVASDRTGVAQQCRACGRELKRTGTDGVLMCMNGHRAVG